MIPPYFIGPLRFDCPPDNNEVMILTAPLEFRDSRGDRVVCPAGLETDGASIGALLKIPIIGWLAQLVLGGNQFTGPFRWPAIPHDCEYAHANEPTFWPALVSRKRAAADRRIFEGARCRWVVMPGGRVVERQRAPWWRAAGVHLLLRLAGFKAWMDDSSRAQKSLAQLPTKLPTSKPV